MAQAKLILGDSRRAAIIVTAANPRLIALRFLENSGFFAYQNYHLYLPKLSQEVKAALSPKNPFNLTLPVDWQPLQDTPSIYSMELGGTYLKLYQSQIKKGKVIILREEKIPFYKNINYTPNTLFANLQKALDKFIPDRERPELSELYFIFAFPLHPIRRPHSFIDSEIRYFGKTRKSRGIIGLPLGQKLENYLRRQGYFKINVAVINDGLANLLAAKTLPSKKRSIKPLPGENNAPDLLLNLIAGTGTNICAAYRQKNQLHLNNLEFGDFHSFPAATFDQRLNAKVPAPTRNRYLTEKMFAGTWQNQLMQIITKQLIKEKILTTLPRDSRRATIHSNSLPRDSRRAAIHSSALPHPLFLSWSSAELEKFFAGPAPKAKNRQRAFLILQIIWQELSKRGAFICAITLSQIIQTLTTRDNTTPRIQILLSGAILEHNQTFRQNLKKFLKIPSAEFLLLDHTTHLGTAMLRQLQKSL